MESRRLICAFEKSNFIRFERKDVIQNIRAGLKRSDKIYNAYQISSLIHQVEIWHKFVISLSMHRAKFMFDIKTVLNLIILVFLFRI